MSHFVFGPLSGRRLPWIPQHRRLHRLFNFVSINDLAIVAHFCIGSGFALNLLYLIFSLRQWRYQGTYGMIGCYRPPPCLPKGAAGALSESLLPFTQASNT